MHSTEIFYLEANKEALKTLKKANEVTLDMRNNCLLFSKLAKNNDIDHYKINFSNQETLRDFFNQFKEKWTKEFVFFNNNAYSINKTSFKEEDINNCFYIKTSSNYSPISNLFKYSTKKDRDEKMNYILDLKKQ